MRSTHSETVSAALDEAWRRLTSGETVLSLVPGATLRAEGAGAAGSLVMKLGSTQVTYRVTATGSAKENTATARVNGKEARGNGTLDATLDVALSEQEGQTLLEVVADVTATGRAESVTTKTWERSIGRVLSGFAAALAGSGEVDQPDAVQPEPTPQPPPAPVQSERPGPTTAPEPSQPQSQPTALATAGAPSGSLPRTIALAAALVAATLLLRRLLSRRSR